MSKSPAVVAYHFQFKSTDEASDNYLFPQATENLRGNYCLDRSRAFKFRANV